MPNLSENSEYLFHRPLQQKYHSIISMFLTNSHEVGNEVNVIVSWKFCVEMDVGKVLNNDRIFKKSFISKEWTVLYLLGGVVLFVDYTIFPSIVAQ